MFRFFFGLYSFLVSNYILIFESEHEKYFSVSFLMLFVNNKVTFLFVY